MPPNANEKAAPLVMRGARASGADGSRQDFADSNIDPMPQVVKRLRDGQILSRDTNFTEVHQETTDDN